MPPDTLSVRSRSSASWLKAFVAVVCFVIAALEAWRDWGERTHELARIEAEMTNLAKSLAQHAEDTFTLADAVLVDILDRVERDGATPTSIANLDAYLAGRIQTLQALKSLTIYGEDGFVLSSSLAGHSHKVNGRDLAFFQHHATSSDKGWYLGPIIIDPLGSEWVLTLSRTVSKPDGSFGGVAQVSIPPRYFANFFSRFNLGPQSSIAMFDTRTGTLLARYPYITRSLGVERTGAPWLRSVRSGGTSGVYVYPSPIDGIERLSAYQKNHVYPVTLLSAVSKDQALAGWAKEFLFHTLAIAVLVSVIGVLGWRLAGEFQRREEVEAELAILAATDGLTGLANRRSFDRQLEVEWLRASRDGTPLSLFLIDVDQFKAYNDHYGHQAGDDCLRKIAKVFSEAASRPGDLVARYGGEEIVVLLPDTDAANAASVAETIRKKVEALALRHDANIPSRILTISIGSVTHIPAHDRARHSASELVAMADKALYRAKQEGRNRVSIAKAA